MSQPDPCAALALPLSDRRNRLMWITPGRVFYAGLLGEMSLRRMGGWLVYASFGAPLRLSLGTAAAAPGAATAWQTGRETGRQTGQLAVVPPYVPHRLACAERLVCSLVIEPETVADLGLPAFVRGAPGVVLHEGDTGPAAAGARALFERIGAVHAWLRDHGQALDLRGIDFDSRFFGQPLARRSVDARIARVLAALSADPSLPHGAQDCAAAVGLSFSRFLHLFKQEAGVSFRSLRSWKRARSLLHHVTRPANLAHLALDSGYPDSTHFSHSIRQVYGLKPRDLFAGSRRLRLLGEAPAAAAQSLR